MAAPIFDIEDFVALFGKTGRDIPRGLTCIQEYIESPADVEFFQFELGFDKIERTADTTQINDRGIRPQLHGISLSQRLQREFE